MNVVQAIQSQIADLQTMLNNIQDQCSHPAPCVVKIAKSGSSDGYATDSYWYDCSCGLCEKTWSEDQ